MAKLILHSRYTNGIYTVQLNDMVGDTVFIQADGKYVKMMLDSFLRQFTLLS